LGTVFTHSAIDLHYIPKKTEQARKTESPFGTH